MMETVKIHIKKVFEVEDGTIAIIQLPEHITPMVGNKFSSNGEGEWQVIGVLSHYIPQKNNAQNLQNLISQGEWHCKIKPLQENKKLNEGSFLMSD